MYVSAFLSGAEALDDKHYEAASKYFAEALSIQSDDAVVWVGFAEARAHLGDSSGAITSLERALERDPGNEEAKSKLDAIIAERNAQNKKPARRSTSRPRSFIRRSISGASPFFEQGAVSRAQVMAQAIPRTVGAGYSFLYWRFLKWATLLMTREPRPERLWASLLSKN
jgi:tetratricopeptide (TPR) repeat protein